MFPEKIPLTRFSRLAGLAGYWPDLLANDLSPGEKRTAQASSRPPRMRADRIIYIVLWAVVIVLKGVAIFHFRADSDETQHAHVVWGWATGQLQYRDLFDNHMPLFQVVMSPFMRVLGERADILIWLRLAMLPFYAASVWCVYKLAALLFNARVAAWTALYSAVWFQFFYTSTEFRPDDMWAALWLGSLLVAVGGKFTVRRAFLLGVLLGLTFSVSMKTVALVLALIPAGIIALSLVWAADPKSISTIAVTSRLLASVAGMLVAPLAIVLYFASENAFWIMYYCVIRHNMVPGLKKWGSNPLFRWTFPAAVPLLIAYAFLIRRQCRDISLAARRIVVILAPLLYLPILVSYWPEVTREDALPYAPLLPLAPVPLIYLLWAGWPRLKNAPMLWSFILPLAGACEILGTCHAQNLHNNRLGVMTHSIRDVLMLTHRDDYVMDDKGEYIFRPRPTYWVFEPLTVIRICSGSITEDLPARLEETGTKICYFNSARRAWPEVSKFIASCTIFHTDHFDSIWLTSSLNLQNSVIYCAN